MKTDRRAQLAFYLGLPIIVGFLLGANMAGVGARMPWIWSVIFWTTCTLFAWAIFDLGTMIASRLLRPWKVALTVKLALGLLIASVPARFLINQYVGLYTGVILSEGGVRSLPSIDFTMTFASSYFKGWTGVYVLWVCANLFFDRIVGFPRYRELREESPGWRKPDPGKALSPASAMAMVKRSNIASVPEAEGMPGEPPLISELLSKLPRNLGHNVILLRSEDHYLRVHTVMGNTLILHRLSDAIEEMEMLGIEGLRVHRSFWVAKAAVEGSTSEGRKLTLHLIGGLNAPVSRTYREFTRAAGIWSD